MARKRKRSNLDDTPRKRRRKKKGRGGRFLLIMLLLVGALIVAAPTIIAKSPLRQQLLSRALPGFTGKARIGSASVSWFTPIVLRDVVIVDEQNELLAEVEEVSLNRTLWQLMLNRNDLGELRVTRPAVVLLVRPGGSNWEDALASIPKSESSGGTMPLLTIEVVEGAIVAREVNDERVWTVRDISGTVALGETGDIQGKLNMKLQQDEEMPGDAVCQCNWNPGEGMGSGEASLTTTAVPLSTLRPLLTRLGVVMEVAGNLTSESSLQWGTNGEQLLTINQCNATQIQIEASQWLGEEPVQMANADATGSVRIVDGLVTLEDVSIATDVGKLQAAGSAPITEITAAAWLRIAERRDFRLSGDLDLAKLAQAMPSALNIREDVEIRSGKVNFSIVSEADAQSRRSWSADVETSQLAAISAGQQISWDQPIRLEATAKQTADGPVIEKLDCYANFLDAHGSGSLEGGQITLNSDLDRLTAELGALVDLSQVQLQGAIHGKIQWKQSEPGALAISGVLTAQQFSLAAPGIRPWQEDKLELNLKATGRVAGAEITELSSASIEAISGSDVLVAHLMAPVATPTTESSANFSATLTGDIARWAARLQSFVPFGEYKLQGTADMNLSGAISLARTEIGNANIKLQEFGLTGGGLNIHERAVAITAEGATWSQQDTRLKLADATLASSAISIRGRRVMMQLAEAGLPSFEGDTAFTADIARLQGWFSDPRNTPQQLYYGVLSGGGKVSHHEGVTSANCQGEVANFVWAKPAVPSGVVTTVSANSSPQILWQEPKITLQLQGDYQHALDNLQVIRCDVGSELANVSATGTLASLTTMPTAKLQGKINYDLARVAVKLRPTMGADFDWRGAKVRDFSIKGPLLATTASADVTNSAGAMVHPDLTAKASLGWDSAVAYGMPIGPGELEAVLSNGVIKVTPFNIPIAEGKVAGGPVAYLNNEPAMLNLGSGTMIDQVRISPEMCSNWMKYVAPMLADATRAEGTFSLDLEEGIGPLLTPSRGRYQGTLAIHSAEVSAGPLGKQVVGTAYQIVSLVKRTNGSAVSDPRVTIPAQHVVFQVADGRVYHKDLTMQVDGMNIRTSGSVGFDQTLQMVAQVPIREEWVGSDPIARTLSGQTIDVPITGTLSRPQIDPRVINTLTQKMLQGGANQLIDETLQRGLQGLFGQ